jgi:UDP-3-O-[3-hydroxymyristoyl] N-acetylglucosamine deacetylase/3-hydroxyacyl-[acyl-carrier-protein] dehydratase
MNLLLQNFCFYEVEDLADQGLIKGGDLDNAVIVDHQLKQDELDNLGRESG